MTENRYTESKRYTALRRVYNAFMITVSLVVTVFVGGLLVYVFTLPECAESGCHNSVSERGEYCYEHAPARRDSTADIRRTTGSYTPAVAHTEKTYTTTTVTTPPPRTTKRYDLVSDPDDDLLEANDYIDAEDFYYDNADWFEDYEEAEDYWDDYN